VKPDYKAVCANGTGHAEVVEVEYDPAVLSFGALVDVFWASHDPFAGLRTGADLGDQYRSAIFFHSPEQEAEARASAAQWEARNGVGRSVATEISLAAAFHPAEEYHQRYYEKQGTRQDAGAP
jgi:methionine-S-sulfoxide reductase